MTSKEDRPSSGTFQYQANRWKVETEVRDFRHLMVLSLLAWIYLYIASSVHRQSNEKTMKETLWLSHNGKGRIGQTGSGIMEGGMSITGNSMCRCGVAARWNV